MRRNGATVIFAVINNSLSVFVEKKLDRFRRCKLLKPEWSDRLFKINTKHKNNWFMLFNSAIVKRTNTLS